MNISQAIGNMPAMANVQGMAAGNQFANPNQPQPAATVGSASKKKVWILSGSIGGGLVCLALIYFLFFTGGDSGSNNDVAQSLSDESGAVPPPREQASGSARSNSNGGQRSPSAGQGNPNQNSANKNPTNQGNQNPNSGRVGVNQTTNNQSPTNQTKNIQPTPKSNTQSGGSGSSKRPQPATKKEITAESLSGKYASAKLYKTTPNLFSFFPSRDGKKAVGTGGGRVAYLTLPENESEPIKEFRKNLLAISSTGKFVAAIDGAILDDERVLKIWNQQEKKLQVSVPVKSVLWSGVFSDDESRFYLNDNEKLFTVDLSSGEVRESESVVSVSPKLLHATNDRLIHIGDYGVELFDLKSGEALKQFSPVDDDERLPVFAAAGDGRSIIAAKSSKVWRIDLQQEKVVAQLDLAITEDAYKVAISHDGSLGVVLLKPNRSGFVAKILSLQGATIKLVGVIPFGENVRCGDLHFTTSNNLMALVTDDSTGNSYVADFTLKTDGTAPTNSTSAPIKQKQLQANGFRLDATSPALPTPVSSILSSKDNQVVVAQAPNGLLYRWSVKDNELFTFNKEKEEVRLRAIRDDGWLVYSSGLGIENTVWNVQAGKKICTLESDQFLLNNAGKFVNDSTIRLTDTDSFLLWNVQKNTTKKEFDVPIDEFSQTIKSLFNRESNTVWVSTLEGELLKLDSKGSLKEKKRWKEKDDYSEDFLQFANDGKYYFTLKYEANIWHLIKTSLSDGSSKTLFSSRDYDDLSAWVSTDGRYAIVKYFKLRSVKKQILLKLTQSKAVVVGELPFEVTLTSFDKNNTHILGTSDDQRIRIWRIN